MRYSTRKWGGTIFGVTSAIIIGYTFYMWLTDQTVGFNEIISCAIVLSAFLSAITWGTPDDPNGPRQDEELGRHITMKSAKISYFVLVVLLLLALAVDKWLFGRENTTLLLVFSLSIIILPLTEWLVSRQYR